MASLSLKHIYKTYDNGFSAVKDFNLEVADKEFIVFVGPSGCGKSTTLRMIAGLEDISEGEFYIGDRLVNNVEPKDRDIAMVFQSYALYPHMTVFDNMAFALKLRKVPKDEIKRKVEEASKILGLDELLDRKPRALSGGQRQRVALGRAIVRSPKVFLMDEPLSNLDAKLRSNMRAEIIKIHNALGATTIYVTHDQTEAMTMADRIVVMKLGVIQQIGQPKEIYDEPRNLFVAGFIGAPTMNFLHGHIKEGNFITKEEAQIEIPEAMYKKLKDKGYEGKEVVLGIRPENISNDPLVLETYSHAKITSKVIVAELLGSEYIVHTDLGGESIKAIVHSRQNIKMGDEITFALDMNRAHFFDTETELSILLDH
ncbi:ABC transporter ATP-binding protein [Gemelliphila palaticanis]|uniref:Sn-glycerol-3-phosphate ABC transporter ATP-binding protein UgpC n=1 Tax=Gemelliphila palaticanis TaxID=81950 RepID=A0ABX2SZ30_9BACL|nr:sn-glycerol-3-phosphate ABC transporter ATP-binding protein UgpC [Gemella palaticanis]MBF0715383.1 sn-glycerol-3-phosphate ABC transporter ATP-binding protein UgpC [Gemella palaticanis]NYS47313.1 sn-glycerol-3-phosphate ABC transporter ATP-binding protein UgpC [Gemella palaticanis]